MRRRVAFLPNADLQGAAIRHHSRDMKTGGIFVKIDRLFRRREKREVVFRRIENCVEFFGGDFAVTRHERKPGADLSHEQEIRAALAAGLEQVHHDVGVAGQAIAIAALRHQLRHDAHIHAEDVIQRMGVIRRDIILLRHRIVQPAARQKEEIVDLDVRRQLSRPQRLRIGQFGITAEQPFDHRRQKPLFQFVGIARFLKRQSCEYLEVDRLVRGSMGEDRVGDVIGLAQPQRQRQNHTRSQRRHGRGTEVFGVIEDLRH